MKRIVLLASVVLLMACGGGTVKKQAANTFAEKSAMTIALSDSLLLSGKVTDTIDLGRIRAGEVVRRDLMIRNDDAKPFVILSVKTSCGCTTVDFAKEPVLPGKSVPFSFEFDSKGFKGYQLKHITISTSISSTSYVLVATAEVV